MVGAVPGMCEASGAERQGSGRGVSEWCEYPGVGNRRASGGDEKWRCVTLIGMVPSKELMNNL